MMDAPTTRQKQARRLGQKGLYQQLCERFQNDYGFEKGRRIIPVIVDDILNLVHEYYAPDGGRQPNQIVYTAAHAKDRPTRGKTMAQTRQQAVCLTIIASDDWTTYAQGASTLTTQRLVRWLHEAQAQDALLTTADLAFISGLSVSKVERDIRRYEQATATLLPLRGTIHDCSSKLTHKVRIVKLHLQGCLPTEIARATDHSLEAVEQYLRDFELVRHLAPHHDEKALSRLAGRGTRVVRQYLDLLKQHRRQRKRDTPVRGPSVSPQSGSHEPATDRVTPTTRRRKTLPHTPGRGSRGAPPSAVEGKH
jgi:hypothetical protein